jgi:hypothetical protein
MSVYSIKRKKGISMPNKYKKTEGTVKPQEGYETDGEVKAANENDRLDHLKRIAKVKDNVARRAKTDLTRQDNFEAAKAYRTHANALERVVADHQSGWDNETHIRHSDYLKALEEYRASRTALKSHGRWDGTFKQD